MEKWWCIIVATVIYALPTKKTTGFLIYYVYLTFAVPQLQMQNLEFTLNPG